MNANETESQPNSLRANLKAGMPLGPWLVIAAVVLAVLLPLASLLINSGAKNYEERQAVEAVYDQAKENAASI